MTESIRLAKGESSPVKTRLSFTNSARTPLGVRPLEKSSARQIAGLWQLIHRWPAQPWLRYKMTVERAL
jgi:hypothetical protein